MPCRRPQHVDDVMTDDDLLVTVCDRAHEELAGAGGVHWSVPDPARTATTAAFEAAYDDLSARVGELSRFLTV